MALLEVPPRCYEKKHGEHRRLQYRGSAPHIPRATWQQIFCSDSSPLFLTHDYMVVWLFFRVLAALIISVLIAIWVLSTAGTCQKDVICLLRVLYGFEEPPRDWETHFFSHVMGTAAALGLQDSLIHVIRKTVRCHITDHVSLFIFVLTVKEVPKLSYLCVLFL